MENYQNVYLQIRVFYAILLFAPKNSQDISLDGRFFFNLLMLKTAGPFQHIESSTTEISISKLADAGGKTSF